MDKRSETDAATPEQTSSTRPARSANEVTGSTVAPHRQDPLSGSVQRSEDELLAAHAVSAQPPVTHEQIAIAAYYRAEQRGFEAGYELEDWLQAERELAATAMSLARGVR